MSQNIRTYSNDIFSALLLKFGFKIESEKVSYQFYLVEYTSENYVIKVEKYFREFYPSVHSLYDQDNEINLFNLLGFLKQNDSHTPKSEFFREEKNIEECYKKQLNHISNVIYDNLNLLDDFFSKDKYEKNALEFHNFWKSKHPEFYRTL